jgi:hypothetical protein
MKTATRILALAGAGLMSGAVVGAGPAQAATSIRQAPAGLSASQAQGDHDDDVIGYFWSRRACERVGRAGEWADRWEDHDCEFVRWGYHRGQWRLEVDRGWDWDGPGDDHHGGGGGHDGDHHGDGDHHAGDGDNHGGDGHGGGDH